MKKKTTPMTAPYNLRVSQVRERKVINIGFDPQTYAEIEHLASVSGISIPRLIRHAINNVLDKQLIEDPNGDFEVKF